MVIYLDVDKYLNKADYRMCIKEMKWPWKETHFVRVNKCFVCGLPTNPKLMRHFFRRTDINITFQQLINTKFFWCDKCMFAVYEHYPSDECEFCVA